MGCWFNNHDYQANPHDRDYNDEHCVATCKKCGNTKWIDFGEYSMFYAGLTEVTDAGSYIRHMEQTMRDPWGRVKTKEILRQMDEWRKAGYPTEGM